MVRTAASITSLMTLKDVTREQAIQIRHIWLQHTPRGRAKIDKILQTFGVELLGEHKRSKHLVWYCNAGDSYAPTILFVGPHLRVGTWADLMEKNLIRELSNDDLWSRR